MRHLLFYKPYGVLTQFSDSSGSGHPTLAEFIDVPEVYAAGRLDRDSEGLLLLTSDGELQHRLTDPRFEHPRTYWVQVEGTVTAEALKRLQAGVVVQGEQTRPAEARSLDGEPELPPREPPIRVRKSIPTAWIELTLREGRNRQVRRMTAAVGLPTLRLVRAAIGTLTLDGLKPGQWRDLTAKEVQALQARLAKRGGSGGAGRPPAGRPGPHRPAGSTSHPRRQTRQTGRSQKTRG